MAHPPMPVPIVSMREEELPLDAPDTDSASPAQLTSFSTSQGIPNRLSMVSLNRVPAYSGINGAA